MKQFFTIFLIIELILFITACKKNNESIQQTYRPYVYSITYGSPNPISETHLKYKNDYLINKKSYTDFQDSLKQEYEYFGDTVTTVFSKKEGSEWKVIFTRVFTYSNNNINSIFDYYGDTSYSNTFKYENSKLVELKSFMHSNNISTQTEATYYTYLDNKLSKTEYYKRRENEELNLDIKREFYYDNGKLFEEWIYSTKQDIPIQLMNKKFYKYEDNKLSMIEEYILENEVWKLKMQVNLWYHFMENLTLKIKSDSDGEVLEAKKIKYEPGNMNTYSYYDAFIGENIIIYKPSL